MKLSYSLIKPISITLLTLAFFSSNAFASTKQWPLQRKGEVRYLKMIKVYDIGLYSPTKVSSKDILKSNISKCLKLDYAVSLTEDKFKLATSKILNRQHSPKYLETIKVPLASLQNAYKPVKKGDSYSLCYNGRSEVMRLDLNDKKLFEVKSAKLAQVYLGIWLSKNNPISKPLFRTFFPGES